MFTGRGFSSAGRWETVRCRGESGEAEAARAWLTRIDRDYLLHKAKQRVRPARACGSILRRSALRMSNPPRMPAPELIRKWRSAWPASRTSFA
ncbi:hypothetical protein GN956_G3943 [Arapaima gigas]